MREAWRELMFADIDQAANAMRDPMAPAVGCKAAPAMTAPRYTASAKLMTDLAPIVLNTCRALNAGPAAPPFGVLTTLKPKQRRAL